MNTGPEPAVTGFDRAYADEQIRRREHPLRRFVKGFYLRNLLSDLRGPTIDVGCGAGQLLERLPAGSLGLEVNPHLIRFLEARGLQVRRVAADASTFDLPGVSSGQFDSLVIAHVLEHLEDPAAALRHLLTACRRVGISRVVMVVPGLAGFRSDRTHLTFVDRTWVECHAPAVSQGFALSSLTYFPGPWAWVGRFFVFHEMKLVFDRLDSAG